MANNRFPLMGLNGIHAHINSNFLFCNKNGVEVLLRATILRSKRPILAIITNIRPREVGSEALFGVETSNTGDQDGQANCLP